MEAMCTAYAEKLDLIWTLEYWKKMAHRLRTKFCFTESFDKPDGKGATEMHHLFPYFFSLVRILEFLYVNFSSTCVQCTHLLKS